MIVQTLYLLSFSFLNENGNGKQVPGFEFTIDLTWEVPEITKLLSEKANHKRIGQW